VSPRTICILRLSAMGDVTHVVPVLRAINRHLPQTRVSWIVGKAEARLLQGIGDVELVVFDKRGGLRSVLGLRKQLRGRRFDALLHMQVSARANLISTLVSAPVRIGWDKPRWRDRHQWFISQCVRSVAEQHQVDAFLEFAAALGLPAEPPVWNLAPAREDSDWAAQQLPGGAPVLLISPCSSHRHRNWASERYAAVADHAISVHAMRVALVGGPSAAEKKTARDIESAMQHRALNLVGKDTPGKLMALLQRAAVLLSPDSGPVHLASALGTPVIGLYAATPSRRSGPYRSLELCVDRYAEAARRYLHKDPQQLRWGRRIEVPGVMDLVETADVCRKLDQAMENA